MSDNSTKILDAKRAMREFIEILQSLPDAEVQNLFAEHMLADLVTAILDPSKNSEFRNYAEFYLANKHRSTSIAILQYLTTRFFSFEGKGVKGGSGFVSPNYVQWFDDGVMLLEGPRRFEGVLTLYRDGQLYYAIARRDIRGGDAAGPEDFSFVSLEETQQTFERQNSVDDLSDLQKPVAQLQELLREQNNIEAKYQELLGAYPWVLGLEYAAFQRHEKLDDRNIPDFTGVRVFDKARNIFEIKPPFMQIFRQDGTFSSAFNDAWYQAERYLSFVQQNRDYLYRERGLIFENPKCYLIVGYNLTDIELQQLRNTEHQRRTINILTYNDLEIFMNATSEWIHQRISALK